MTDPLDRVSKICLALPKATVEQHGRQATYRVRRKPFAYFLDDHQGDGMVAVSFRAGERARATPERFYPPAYMGPRGWLALRLDTGPVDWDEVEALVVESWLLAGGA